MPEMNDDQLEACARAWRKRVRERLQKQPVIRKPGDVVALMSRWADRASQEEFRALLLDTRRRILGKTLIARGTLHASLVDARSVFRNAIRKNAQCIVLLHNHPSGDPTPSTQDIDVTARLKQAGTILNIEILDHLILGKGGDWLSMKQEGYMQD